MNTPPDFTPRPQLPRMPQAPWYTQKSAPLGPDEWDDYDELMRPREKPGRRGSLFTR